MKRELMEGHALNMTYNASNKAINKETWAFYQGTAYTPNHSGCIVGWDDNNAVENFKDEPPQQAPGWSKTAMEVRQMPYPAPVFP